MVIIIPTYQRVHRQFTLREIPPSWHSKTFLIANQKEAHQLRRLHPTVNVIAHPERINSIAKKRVWILEEAYYNGVKKLLMLDDDLRFCRRNFFKDDSRHGFNFKILKANFADVDWAFKKVDKMLDKFAHVGIGPRQGNNGIRLWKRWNPNTRMIYALGYRVSTVVANCKLGRIQHREDMELNLQLLTKGFENRVLIEVLVDQTYGGPGGARDERSVESSNIDAEKLQRMFPKYVQVVDKEYKQSIPRKEVIVKWKHAIAYGIRKQQS